MKILSLLFATLLSCQLIAQDFSKRDFKKVISLQLEEGKPVEYDLARYCAQYPKNEEAKLKLMEVSLSFMERMYTYYNVELDASYSASNYNPNMLISGVQSSQYLSAMKNFGDIYQNLFGAINEVEIPVYEYLPFEEVHSQEKTLDFFISFPLKANASEMANLARNLREVINKELFSINSTDDFSEDVVITAQLLVDKAPIQIRQASNIHKELQALQYLTPHKRITNTYSIVDKFDVRDTILSIVLVGVEIENVDGEWESNLKTQLELCENELWGPPYTKTLHELSESFTAISALPENNLVQLLLGKNYAETYKDLSENLDKRLEELYSSVRAEAESKIKTLIYIKQNEEKKQSWIAHNSVELQTPSGQTVKVLYNSNAFDQAAKWISGVDGKFNDEGYMKLLSIDDHARGVMSYMGYEIFGEHHYSFSDPGGNTYTQMQGKHFVPIGYGHTVNWTEYALARKLVTVGDRTILGGSYVSTELGKEYMATYVLEMNANGQIEWVEFFDYKGDEIKHTYPQQILVDNDNHLHVILTTYDICPDFQSACIRLGSAPSTETKWLRMPLDIPEYGFDEVYENDQVFSEYVSGSRPTRALKLEGVKYIWSFGFEQAYLAYGINPNGSPIFMSLRFGEGERVLNVKSNSSNKTTSSFIVDDFEMVKDEGLVLIFGRYNRFHHKCGDEFVTIETKSQDVSSTMNYFALAVNTYSGEYQFIPFDRFTGTPLDDVAGYKFHNNEITLPDGNVHGFEFKPNCVINEFKNMGDNTDLFEEYSKFYD